VTSFLIVYNVAPDWLFGGDWFKLVNMALLALTNGYVGTLLAVKGPDRAPDDSKE